MAERTIVCPICKSKDIIKSADYERMLVFYACPVCGRYELGYNRNKTGINENHLASYLFYHCFNNDTPSEYRYNTILDKDTCDTYKKEFESGNRSNGFPVHMDADIVENWYPKTFSERIDRILLFLSTKIPHIGQQIVFSRQEMLSMLFVDRKELNESGNTIEWRERRMCNDEAEYILNYLKNNSYIRVPSM